MQSHDTETHEKEGEEELQRLMREALERHETAATPLGSFPAVFAPQLALGTLSRRRVYAAAQKVSIQENILRRVCVLCRASHALQAPNIHVHLPNGAACCHP